MLYLEELQASAIRNLDEFTIKLSKGINFFYGSNASGKTSVLETIYLLSRFKSFRSKRIHDVITRGKSKLQVFAKGVSDNNPFIIGMEKGHGIKRLKFNGEIVQTASKQAKKLPIYTLTPDYHILFIGTPKDRRHWLDWSLFHVKQDYLHIWKSYHRALRHRNALLKLERGINVSEISGWEKLMMEEALKIDFVREEYLSRLDFLMNSIYLPTVLSGEAKFSYHNFNYSDIGLDKLLAANRIEDVKRGFTGLGPHRTDVVFSYEDFNVAKYLSRGQIKLYSAALISSQIKYLKENGIESIMLVDDLDAELDDASSKKMLKLLLINHVQTFVSSLVKQQWGLDDIKQYALFHVEQGKIEKVIE